MIPDVKALQDKLSEAAERHRVPGAAIGVQLGDDSFYACHGVTSVENPLPVDEHTLFQIGSTTKTLTGTALCLLADRGLVDLAAPVRTYLPGFRVADEDTAARVTVLQLLNHTAGWEGDFFADTGSGDDAVARFVELMADLPQAHPLGARASYNNASLSVAGRVIEVVTGKAYEAALTELLLEPLGLTETGFHADFAITRRFVVGHIVGPDEVTVARPWNFPRSGVPAGVGVVSSVRDQIRYARFHLGLGELDGDRLAPAGPLAAMQQPTTDYQLGHFGISWQLRSAGDATVVSHGGSTHGQQSEFEFSPERDFAVTVLTNASSGHALGAELVSWARRQYADLVIPAPQAARLSATELAEYAGRYERPEQFAQITVSDGVLTMFNDLTDEGRKQFAAIMGGADWPEPEPPQPLVLLHDDWFGMNPQAPSADGRFVRDSTGGITGLDLGGRLAHRV